MSLSGQWLRRAAVAAGLGLVAGAAAAPSGAPADARGETGYVAWAGTLHRSGIDLLLAARHALYGPLHGPVRDPADGAAEPEVAVVALDEETYATPPFAGTPRVTWTPMLGRVVQALDEAGARVIGLDVIYPTTLDRPDLLPGFDRPLLVALYRTGRAGRLVMGEARLSQQPLLPARGQVAAVGGAANLAPLNLLLDADEIVRRHPAGFDTEGGGRRPSFAVELARRAGLPVPVNDFLIDYDTGPVPVPTYSLADVHACAEAGDAGYLAEHFAGRIVLIGSTLDVEDRRLAANRLVDDPPQPTPRCVVERRPGRFGEIADRRSIPGVYIHAAAIGTIARGAPLAMPGAAGNFALVGGTTAAASLLFFALSPAAGAAAAVAVLAAGGLAATVAFRHGFVVPAITLALALFLAFAAVYAYRSGVEDRARRRIQTAFRHYLAPALVDQLAERADSLRLGGETRRVTVWFSDIAGYTGISEGLRDSPDKLVEVVNRYFTAMSAVVERHGAYIDKFIGDAVMCVWGAPLPDAQAERRSLEAALDCVAALEAFNRDTVRAEYGLPEIGTRIGINSGPAVAGNMGSTSRFNYTVTGDTVNLAARLEGANKAYGSSIMVGEETARGLHRDYVLRRLDRIVVKGASIPKKVYELIARRHEADAATLARIRAFHRALALHDRRRFAEARDAFDRLAPDDPPAALYAGRCRLYLETPPPDDWDGSFTMTEK